MTGPTETPGPSHVRGRWSRVPVQLTFRMDGRDLERQLLRMGENAAKAVDYTIRDMAKRGPTIIARNAAEDYNIVKSRLNPRNKKAHGSLSVSGGLKDLTFTYVGPPTPVKDFRNALTPARYPGPVPYVVTARYLRDRPTILGHWRPPGSEGGKYGAKSPRMYIKGKGKFGPVQRVGRGWAGGNFGPSVPQMVMNQGNDEQSISELSELMEKRLMNHLRRFGVV